MERLSSGAAVCDVMDFIECIARKHADVAAWRHFVQKPEEILQDLANNIKACRTVQTPPG